MPQFDKFQIEDLKDYVSHSDIHDAKIENLRYDRVKRILTIETINPSWGAKINVAFKEVKVVLSVSGNWHGSRDTILSLTVEDDYAYVQNFTQVCGNCLEDTLYLMFQMFSGDELHIVAEKVLMEKTPYSD